MKWLLVVILLACKSESSQPPAPKPALGFVAEIRAEATLVTGTRRFALRTSSWFEGPKLVEKPEIAAAIAKEEHGVIDVFLGTTPIVVGGEEHRESHVRVAPRAEVALDGLAAEVVTVAAREVWRYEHELRTQIAIVDGATVTPAPALERIGPESSDASPVSKRLCSAPRVVDLDASPADAFALVTECSDDAPIRILRIIQPNELRLPSRKALDIAPAVIAVGRDGTAVVVGTRRLQIAVARADGTVTTQLDGITRVVSAVLADDGKLWTLALDDAGYVLARDGQRLTLANRDGIVLAPKALGLDDTLGVVVLASDKRANWLLAERPPAGDPITIAR